ncbi:MAG: hypothetical protein IJS84_06065 [Spirochaetales bacterium]|nr:hypothetical protein [Spirochaetales bacterium]
MNSTTIFLLAALILALIALAIAVFAFLKANKALEKSSRDRIDRLARKTFDQQFDTFYGQKIKNLVHDEFVKQQAKTVSVAKDVASVPSSEGDDNDSAETKVDEKAKEEGPVEIQLPEPVTIYTGSYRTGSFRHTTLTPDEKTIFTITAESKDAVEGVLNIDVNAYDKIAQTPDYLEGACTYSGSGTQLHVIQTGTVYKDNGSWVVKDPIIAEFK